ncbi:ROK family protein [Pseudonocardia sp. NPDC046786]|uniref:ROK family transcriptional regulator n=1 Tax=Pseudonocardia sp. NPDC046786 TaxID=3155471 RepID=UPI0033F4322B
MRPRPATRPSSAATVRTGRRGTNASTVLRCILEDGPVARSTIARRTGLSAAAVTRLYQDLAARGLVRELPVRAPRPGLGRPHEPVDIDERHVVAAGVHVAVPHTTLALTDLRGRVLARDVLPHGATGATGTLARAADRLAGMLGTVGAGRRLLGIGLASGGRVDNASGDIVFHNQLGWRDVPAGRLLADRLGVPVVVENHAHALTRAELLFGAARERARRSAVTLFVGNMLDAALTTGGVVHHGPGTTAGEIAHLPLGEPADHCSCGRNGCLQATVSDRAMGERAAAAGIIGAPSFDALLGAARAGDRAAVDLFRLRLRLIGRAAAVLLDLVNPDVLFVVEGGTGLVPELAPQLLAELHAEVAGRSSACPDPRSVVVPGSFGADVLAVAGGASVLDRVHSDPLGSPVLDLRHSTAS